MTTINAHGQQHSGTGGPVAFAASDEPSQIAALLGLPRSSSPDPDWLGTVEVKSLAVVRATGAAWRIKDGRAISMRSVDAGAKLRRVLWIVRVDEGEIASSPVPAYPTEGALYHWSAILGGRGAGFVTAWLNTIGQFAITAGIDYGLAGFLVPMLGLPPARATLLEVYAVVLASHALANHLGVRLVAVLNWFSAWYHVAGVALLKREASSTWLQEPP